MPYLGVEEGEDHEGTELDGVGTPVEEVEERGWPVRGYYYSGEEENLTEERPEEGG